MPARLRGVKGSGSGMPGSWASSPQQEQNKSTRTCRPRPTPHAGQWLVEGWSWAGPTRGGAGAPAARGARASAGRSG